MKHLLSAFILLVLITAVALAAQQPEQSLGSIKGRVTVEGKALPGVVVSLTKEADRYYNLGSLGNVTTDADGNYRFTGVAAGRYSVSTYSPLFVNADIDHNGMNGRIVAVDAGEAVEDIDFSLARGGVITGRVTDTEGRPVISQPVMLLKVVDGRPAQGYRTPDLQIMTTDDRGIYRIYGVLPGKYLVSAGDSTNLNRAMRGGGRFSNYMRTYHPDVADPSDATAVEITAGGETTGVDIKVGIIKKTYIATGRMVDAETGRPVPNNWYGIGLGEAGRPIAMGGYRTNEKGEFKVELAAPNRVTIYPSSDGENNTMGDPFSFDLTTDRVTGLEIKLRRAQTISGVIVAEGPKSAGVAPSFSDLRVQVNMVGPVPRENRVSAKVRADGSFTVGGLSAGRAFIFVSSQNEAARKPWLMRVERSGAVLERQIEIAEGENISDLRVVISYGSGVLRGQLKIEGPPLDGLMMYVAFHHTGSNRMGGGVLVDARGRFLIEGLPEGQYELSLASETLLRDRSHDYRSQLNAAKQTVTVTNGAETPVLLVLDLSKKK